MEKNETWDRGLCFLKKIMVHLSGEIRFDWILNLVKR